MSHFRWARVEVALKALYKLRNEMGNHFRENTKLTMKLFEALISPILFMRVNCGGLIAMGK